MHIFFLLLEKVVGDCVEGVTPQLVVPHQDEQQVELDPALDVDHFVLPLAHLKKWMLCQSNESNRKFDDPSPKYNDYGRSDRF